MIRRWLLFALFLLAFSGRAEPCLAQTCIVSEVITSSLSFPNPVFSMTLSLLLTVMLSARNLTVLVTLRMLTFRMNSILNFVTLSGNGPTFLHRVCPPPPPSTLTGYKFDIEFRPGAVPVKHKLPKSSEFRGTKEKRRLTASTKKSDWGTCGHLASRKFPNGPPARTWSGKKMTRTAEGFVTFGT